MTTIVDAISTRTNCVHVSSGGKGQTDAVLVFRTKLTRPSELEDYAVAVVDAHALLWHADPRLSVQVSGGSSTEGASIVSLTSDARGCDRDFAEGALKVFLFLASLYAPAAEDPISHHVFFSQSGKSVWFEGKHD